MPVGWGNALSGLLQGFNQGRQQATESQRRREELELRKKQADSQIKQYDIEAKIKEQQLKDVLRRGQLGDEIEMEARGGLAAPGTEVGPRMEGGEFYSQPDQVAAQRKTPSIQQILTAEAVRQGKAPTELLRPDPIETLLKLNQAVQGQAATGAGQTAQPGQAATPSVPFQGPAFPQGATPGITAGGRITLRGNSPQREGVGVEAQTWSRIIKENPGKSLPELREIYNLETRRTAEARGTGAQEGALGVRQRPDYLQNKTDVAAATAAGQPLPSSTANQIAGLETLLNNTLPNIEKNLNENYLGPIKGTDIAFEARRRVGSAVGSPVAPGETTFRQALRDASDQLLRARSGAQINEQEYSRLASLLPKPTDEPKVFREGLARFKGEIQATLANKTRLGVTPRGQLGQPSSPNQPANNRPPPPPGFRY